MSCDQTRTQKKETVETKNGRSTTTIQVCSHTRRKPKQTSIGSKMQSTPNKNPKGLMDIASVKTINRMMTEEIMTFKENRIIKQSHVDLTLKWSQTWEKAIKQQKKKRKKALYIDEKKKIRCTKRVRKKRANFYRKYHDYSRKAKPISPLLNDPELSGDPNMEMDDYVEDFDVNQYL